MKKKLLTLAFGLLLAVGWTNVAQAQRLSESPLTILTQKVLPPTQNDVSNPVAKQELKNESQAPLKAESTLGGLIKFSPRERIDDAALANKFKAPKRAPNRADITASATMTRAEYEAITYDWVDANNNLHSGTPLTEPASNPYQIAYLLGTTYMNKDIPGIKYSAFYAQDHPYPNIEFGWDIPNNSRWPGNSSGTPTTITYNDITISIPSFWLDFNSIQVKSNGTTVTGGSWTYANDGATLPSTWGGTAELSAENGGCCVQQYGATIIIPHSIIDGKENVTVEMSACMYSNSASTTNCTVTISGATPESNAYTSTSYATKTWAINPTAGSSSSSGTYYPNGLTIAAGGGGVVLLNSIYVYDQNGSTLTSWTRSTNNYTSGSNYYYYTLPGWNYSTELPRLDYGSDYYYDYLGYLYEHINYPATNLNGNSSIRVVISARAMTTSESETEEPVPGILVVNGEEKTVTTSIASYEWTIRGTAAQGTRTVDKPEDNGYTVFLVKAKDNAGDPLAYTYSWNKDGLTGLANYFDTFIDEVELLTDGLRLNENTDDAGTMFSYSGDLNKFYFISKGANYWRGSSEGDYWPHYGPTYDMYEEFSPTTTATGDQVTDFYSKLLYGNSYNVLHDCRGVNPMQHYFSMKGNESDEHSSLTNLIFWIPDNRGQQNNQNNYNEEYLPVVGLYTITLEAEAEPAENYSPSNRKYRVDLDWVSSLNSILDFNVDQDYELWVYVYDEQGNPVEDYKVTDLIVDENGLIHNDTDHYYYVDQHKDSYTIVYRIKGWPKDATNSPGKHLEDPENGTFYALSNLAPVLIPGYEDFLSLGVEHYESDFVLDGDPEYAEHNYYRNFLTVGNQNPENALTAQRIQDGEDLYKLYRFDPDNVDNLNKPILTEAADLQFTLSNNKVEYDITYANQFYVDEANLVHVDDNGVSHQITGYTDPNTLGCPTHGEIARISEGGSGTVVQIPYYNDITITTPSSYTYIDSIAVIADGVVLQAWSGYYDFAGTVNAVLPDGWTTSGTFRYYTSGTSANPYCYFSNGGTITIPASLVNGKDNVQVYVDAACLTSYTNYPYVTVAGTQYTLTTSWAENTTNISPAGYNADTGFNLLNNFLDNSSYTQVGIVVFQLPWKSINVKLQEGETASSAGYFKIENGAKLKFVMPAGYNNANLKFVIHNAPVSSDYYDGTFTLVKKSDSETKTITIPKTSNYGDRDYEVIFEHMSSGDVITITGTHTHNGTQYGYSPDFKYIHVYVEGGHSGLAMTDPLNLDAIKFVDQFKAETKEDKHAYSYGYVLKDVSDGDQSSSPEIPVQHTNSKLDGFYSLNDINNDIDAEHIDPVNVMNAEVNMTLSREPEIFYYTLDRKPSNVNNATWEAVSKLQKRGNTDSYQEMFDILPQYEDQICNPPTVTGTPWIVERYDNDDIKTGNYNAYMNYVPVIWTHGDQKNRRVKWDTEKKHNSYGAPIWKTGVAEVTLTSAVAQRQDDPSTKWTYGGEECSLYMLDNIEAVAKMPTENNVNYVPYMFRIFVKSKNGKLRGYTTVAAGEDPNLPGEHYVGAPIDNDTLKCVWNGFVNDTKNSKFGVTISERTDNGTTFYTFHKNKVDRSQQGGEWDKDVENAIFGSTEDLIQGQGENMIINKDDLMIIVRFYYLVEGFDASVPESMQRGTGSDPAGYGVQGDGFQPGPSTAVNEITLNASIESVTYVNSLGMTSDKPFDGMNIVITRYSNGAVTTTKVVR